MMFQIAWVIIIIILPLFAYQPIILDGDLCHDWNGRRIFVDNNEVILLTAKNISEHENRSHCVVNFHACPFCHFQLRLTHFNITSCGYRSRTRCSCSNLTIHEPPHEYSFFNLCEAYKRDKKLYTHTNEFQVAMSALQPQQHVFTLRIRVKRNSFLFANNATCRRGLQEKEHITSPFFPNFYPSTYRVDYIFYNAGGNIRIVFQDFKIGVWSYFEVLERTSDRRKIYSGYSFRPPIIESQGSEMKIRFIGNGASAQGYRFTYHFVNCSGSRINYTEVPITDCGGTVTNLGGSIVMSHMSHREVRSYDCIWVIHPLVPHQYNSDISVRVDRFQYMGSNSTLTIHEGTTSLSRQVLRISGDVQVSPTVRNGTVSTVPKSREYIVPTSTGFYIRLKADLGPHSSLAIVYSLFTYDQCFSIIDVRCNNSRCIIGDLRCDGFDHCGDGSDEPLGCYDEHRLVQWHSSNYYFPKQIHPDAYGSHIMILGCIFLVVLSPVLCGLLFWRITVKGREEYQRHRTLELIRELERDGARAVTPVAVDEPPEYDAPPNYDDALKLGPTPVRRKHSNDGGLLRMFRVTPVRHSTHDAHRGDPPPYEPTPTHHNGAAPRRPKRRQFMRRRVSRSSTCPPNLSNPINSLSLSVPGGSPVSQTSNGLTSNVVEDDQIDTITISSVSNSENVEVLSIVTGKSIVTLGEDAISVQHSQGEANNHETESIIQRTKKLLFSKQASQPKQTQNQRRASIGCGCEGACACDTVLPVKVRKLVFEPKSETLPSTYNFQDLFRTFWQDSNKTEEKTEDSKINENSSKECTSVGQVSRPGSLVQQAKERLFASKKDSSTRAALSRPRFKIRRQKSEPPIFYIDIHASEETPTSIPSNENSQVSTIQSTPNRNSYPMYGNESSTDNRGSWDIFQEVIVSAKNFIKPKVAYDKEMNGPRDSLRKVSSDPAIAEQSTMMHYQSQQTLCSSLESFNFSPSPLLALKKACNSPVSSSSCRSNSERICYSSTKTSSLEHIPTTSLLQQDAKTIPIEPNLKASLENISNIPSLKQFSLEAIPKTSSFEHLSATFEQTRKFSSMEYIPDASSLEYISKASNSEHILNNSLLESIPKIHSLQDLPKTFTLEAVSKTSIERIPRAKLKISSVEDTTKMASMKGNQKIPSLEGISNTPSLESIPKTSSIEQIPKTCSLENIPQTFSLEEILKMPLLEHIPVTSEMKDNLKNSSLEETSKNSLLEENTKMAAVKGIPKTCFPEDTSKISDLEPILNTVTMKKVSKRSSLEGISKASLMEGISNASSLERIAKTAAMRDILKNSSLENISKSSSFEDISKTSSLECIAKIAAMKDIPKTSSLDDISKTSSLENIPKTFSLEDNSKPTSLEHTSKTSSSSEGTPKNSPLNESLRACSLENIPKSEDISEAFSIEEIPKTCSLEDISKVSSLENLSKTCSLQNISKTSSLENISMNHSLEDVSQI